MKTFAIPTDGPALRLYVFSLFALLQALKCYDFISIRAVTNPKLTTFLLKWSFVDSCFIYILPYLNVPWLRFRRSVRVLQIAGVLLLNWGLSFGWEVFKDSGFGVGLIWSALVRGTVPREYSDAVFYNKELGIAEIYVDVGKLLHNTSHIQGRKVVRILPESTAKINPSGNSFCIHPKQSTPLIIPIRLNGTNPMLIQYSHTTFTDPPIVHHHDILARTLKSMVDHAETSDEPGEENLLILPFPITEVGAYKLERVVDTTRNDVRIYRSEAIVVECPSAEISSFNEEGHFCQGETDALKVTVRGVPPLHVQYAQIVNEHPQLIPIDSIHPESFTSPLLAGDGNLQVMRREDYSFAQTHSVTLTYPLSLDTVGLWKYALLEVRDALGNTVSYEDAPPGYGITVHERPHINLRGCSEDSPIKVLKGRDTNIYFNIQTNDPGQFNITLGYTPPESSDPPVVETYKLTHKRDGLSITEPGIYTIMDISTKYCSGDVLTPQSCLVITPSEPTLQIEWSTLKDHCSGTVGVTADLTFTGEPPFHLSYRTLSKNTNQHEAKRIKVDRTRFQMDFKPEVAGTYVYDFIALDDVNYRWIELDGEMFSHEATVHPLPGVKFQDTGARKTCIGSPLDVPIRMIGSGPWNLTYDIVEGTGKRKTISVDIEQSETTLHLLGFQRGGKGTVSLRSVTDGGGCKVQLSEEDLVVDVRREKPSAKFYGNTIQARDGELIKIPLRLTGDGPWRIRYAHIDVDGQRSEYEAYVTDPNGSLETRYEGTYELISVVDSSCPGVIKSEAAKFAVRWVARPKLDIVGAEGAPRHEIIKKPDICAGQDAYLDLFLHGAKPFTIDYNVLKLDDKSRIISRSKDDISAAMSSAQIQLQTSEAGTYRYEFIHLSDAVYDDSKNLETPVVVEQIVRPLPTAKFVETSEPYLYCADTTFDDPKKNGIPILVTGTLPVKVQVELRNELSRDTKHITLDIAEKPYFFVPPPDSLTHGRHVLTILEVQDSVGCIFQPIDHNRATFTVADEASISPIEPQHDHCVGDRISFALQGTSPWQIEYEFDGKRNVAKTTAPTFSRIAERKGNLTIISVADRASECKTLIPPGKIEKIIHEVPSVKISEGTNMVENIREGDQAEIKFQFFGVPPFSMTLRVSTIPDKKNRKSKSIQMHTINNVQGYTHSFYTSQEGIYEVVQLQDRYCRYPREETSSPKLLEFHQ